MRVEPQDQERRPDPRGTGRTFVVGVVVGALLLWVLTQTFGPILPLRDPVRVLEGHTNGVNVDGTAIGFDGSGLRGEGFVIAGADWRQDDGPWHLSEMPTCLEPLSAGQRVTLGVVEVPPVDDAVGRTVVVWLVCHGEPTERS